MARKMRTAAAGVVLLLSASAGAAVQGRDLDNNLDNGFEAYFDPVQNVTWIANASLFSTQFNALTVAERGPWLQSIIAATPVVAGHVVTLNDLSASGLEGTSNGVMTWWGAQAYSRSAVYFGTTGWRLPTMVDIGNDGCNVAYQGTDCGWNVDTSQAELAYMHRYILRLRSAVGPNGEQGSGNVIPFGSSLLIPGLPGASITNLSDNSYWYGNSYAPDPSHAWTFDFSSGYQSPRPNNGATAITRTWLVATGDVFASPVPEPSIAWQLSVGALAVAAVVRRRRQR